MAWVSTLIALVCCLAIPVLFWALIVYGNQPDGEDDEL